MRYTLNNIEIIEKYLLGEMSTEEKVDFENQLSKSDALKRQLLDQQLLMKAIARKQYSKDIQNASNKGKGGKWWFASATILILAVASFFFFDLKNDHQVTILAVEENTTVEVDSNPIYSQKKENELIVSIPKNDSTVEEESMIELDGLRMFVTPTIQHFQLNMNSDATVEGENGTLVFLPKDCFLNENGEEVNGKVDFQLIEALHLSDMLLYNLTTVSNQKALESEGMVYLKAFQDGVELKVNPEAPMYVDIPTLEKKEGMMAFEGEVNDGGESINWKNPKPLKKYLTRVDLQKLDFLPPGFADEVATKMPYGKHKKVNQFIVDSLYNQLDVFSSRVIVEEIETDEDIQLNTETDRPKKGGNRNKRDKRNLGPGPLSNKKTQVGNGEFRNMPPPMNIPKPKKKEKKEEKVIEAKAEIVKTIDSIATPTIVQEEIQSSDYQDDKTSDELVKCRIRPASIRAIQRAKFQNTFIATKEFEARLRKLHHMKSGDRLLKVYVRNLTKNLSTVDSLAAKKAFGKNRKILLEFAAEGATNIKDAPKYQKMLTAYYENFKAKWNKKQGNIREVNLNRNKINLEIFKKEREHIVDTYQNRNKNISLREVQNITTGAAVPVQSYSTPWFSFGWMNIDAFLHELHKSKKPIIIEFTLQNKNVPNGAFGQVYQWLNSIRSLTPIIVSKNKAESRFPNKKEYLNNQTFTYGLFKDKKDLYWASESYRPSKGLKKQLNFSLTKEKEVRAELQKVDPKNVKAISYLDEAQERIEKQLKQQKKTQQEWANKQQEIKNDFQRKLAKNRKKNAALLLKINTDYQLMSELYQFVFPCSSQPESEEISIEKDDLDIFPTPKQGMAVLQKSLMSKIKYPIMAKQAGVSGKVTVKFDVDENGVCSNFSTVGKVLGFGLEEEAIRVVSKMPKWNPGIKNGRALKTSSIFPINFRFK